MELDEVIGRPDHRTISKLVAGPLDVMHGVPVLWRGQQLPPDTEVRHYSYGYRSESCCRTLFSSSVWLPRKQSDG